MPVKKVAETAKKTTTAAKTTAKTTTTRAKATVKKATSATKTATAKASAATQVAANARHIQENTSEIKNNSSMIHVLYGTIIVLMLIIAGLAFYVGQMMGNKSNPSIPTTSVVVSTEDITVTIIDDVRCSDCQTSAIVEQLQVLPFLAWVTFIEQDFSDKWISQYLEDNNITALPAVIFNTNTMNDGGQITPYLLALPDNQYSLTLGATFDPFAKRSDQGFLMMSSTILEEVQADAHYKGDENAKITWLEYTDVNCFYCKKMEEDGTADSVMEAIGSNLNKTSSHFIGVGGAASQAAAEVLECIASVSGADMYNSILSATLLSWDNAQDTLVELAGEGGIDTDQLNACIENGDSTEIVERKFTRGREMFGITGTPGNVIINNETGEYEVISGAYPASAFENVINKMLGE